MHLWLLGILIVAFFASPVVSAQNSGGATNINDLMGERPSNSYYQNSGIEAQGSNADVGSAQSNVLRQESNVNLKVDESTTSTVAVPSGKKSSAWKVYGTMAAVFLALGIIFFIMGIKREKQILETPTETIVDSKLTDKGKDVKPKKLGKKKKLNHVKVKRGKKKK